jgi:hypothetical protein
MNTILKTKRVSLSIRGGLHTGLVCVLLLMGVGVAYGTPGNFGPYVVIRTLPTSFTGLLGGLTFTGGSLYALDTSGNIYQLNPLTGQTLADWSVPGLLIQSGDENPTGLAWDGNTFWMASYGTQNRNYIRGLTLGSSPIATVNITYHLSITSPLNWPMDLTYANGSLMYPQYMGPIREFNPATGQVVGSLPSPNNLVYGLTFDSQDLLAAYGPSGSAPAGTVWRISAQTGAILDTWQTGAPDIYALAYDQLSQTLFIGTRNNGIIVAQAPEPGSITIGALGMIALLLSKASTKRRNN